MTFFFFLDSLRFLSTIAIPLFDFTVFSLSNLTNVLVEHKNRVTERQRVEKLGKRGGAKVKVNEERERESVNNFAVNGAGSAIANLLRHLL